MIRRVVGTTVILMTLATGATLHAQDTSFVKALRQKEIDAFLRRAGSLPASMRSSLFRKGTHRSIFVRR